MAEDPIIPFDDPRFAACHDAAQVLFDEALRMGHAEPGADRAQAAHYAFTALLNTAKLESDMAVKVFGAFLGTTAVHYEDPEQALQEVLRFAAFFLDDARQRFAAMKADTAGSC